jgi:saccharopine dehydrogenase-like NADP-dependent oxidoreductase
MRVAVLGAAGTIAPAIVRDLAGSDEVSSILLLDLDGDRAREVAEAHGGGIADARAADAAADLCAELVGIDVLVNSASYRINLAAMEACLLSGCHYLDLGGLYHLTGKQLALGPRFEQAGLLAVLGIGSSPGKTNLMAAEAVRQLRADAGPLAAEAKPSARVAIDSLHVAAAGRDLEPPPGFSVPYALRTLIDELTLAPVVLEQGEPRELEPLSDGGTIDFGEPIGEAETIHTLHSELRTFGESFGCGKSSFRLSLAPALLRRLRELAAASAEQVAAAAATAVRPSPNTVAVHLVDAAAGDRAIRVRAVTTAQREWGLGGGIVSTAAPAAATVRLLARGQISARGALPPERCIEPAAMFAELEARGTRFETLEIARSAA